MPLACSTQATALERMLSTICLGIFSKYLSVWSSTPTVEDCFALYRCDSGAVVPYYLHGLKLRYSVNAGICFGRDSSTQTMGCYQAFTSMLGVFHWDTETSIFIGWNDHLCREVGSCAPAVSPQQWVEDGKGRWVSVLFETEICEIIDYDLESDFA